MNDPLFDKKGSPDPLLADLEQTLAPLRYQGSLPALPPRQQAPPPAPRRPWRAFAAAAALLLCAGAAAFFYASRPAPLDPAPQGPVWPLEGSASLEGQPLQPGQGLQPGQWLQTGPTDRARLQVADIGQMELSPGTRLRLDATSQRQHRLTLSRGQIHARVIAPPRLLVVHTPLADAVDLGCEYTLRVDEDGATALRVLTGFVALETPALQIFVPAGAQAYALPGLGVGTPAFEDASLSFQEDLRAYDARPADARLLDELLAEARHRDTLSLWHLLFRAPRPLRGAIYDRILLLAPNDAPPDLTRQDAVDLHRDKLQAWQDRLWINW